MRHFRCGACERESPETARIAAQARGGEILASAARYFVRLDAPQTVNVALDACRAMA